jgi:hypothetical protein
VRVLVVLVVLVVWSGWWGYYCRDGDGMCVWFGLVGMMMEFVVEMVIMM